MVSVLLPVWDAEHTLPAALESIRRQTLSDFECVIVDDGSRDGSPQVARQFAAQDARFRVCAAPHRGLVSTLARGLRECKGRHVARMDADDVMHRARLAAQVALLEARAELAAVGCHVRVFPRRGLRDGLRAYERWLNSMDGDERIATDAFVECPVAHPTLMFRREVIERHGYRDCGWPEDYDLVLRMLLQDERIGIVCRRLLRWRDRPERHWRTHPRYQKEQITRCKAAFLVAGPLASTASYVLWGYGATGKALSRELAALGRRPSHIVELHPGRLGQRIAGARVIPPDELERLDPPLIVVSVAGVVPRAQIREALGKMGYRERRDYVCAA